MARTPSIDEIHQLLTAPGQMFETESVTVGDVRLTTWKHAPSTLRQLLDLSLNHGEKDFIVYGERRITFAEHYRLVAALVAHFRARGIGHGDRVVIAARNLPEWIVAFWAITAVGAIAVPLNAWWTTDELLYGLSDSGARAAVVDEERLERIRPRLDELTGLDEILVISEDATRPAQLGPAHERIELIDVSSVLGDPDAPTALPEIAIDTDDDATMFYTSGTTGRPKGAVGTHRNVVSNLMNLFFIGRRSQLRNGSEAPDEVQAANLLNIPLFHATGCFAVMTVALAAGHKLVLTHHFDPRDALATIERERITSIGGVPTIAMQIVTHPDFDQFDTSSVRSVSYGGAPAPPDLVRRIREAFPLAQPGNGYGLTETSAAVCLNSGDDYLARPESCGVPVPVCDVRLVPEGFEGDEPPDEPRGAEYVGELWIKGPNVVRGYWGKPEETAQSFSRGWLRTGDLARIDEQGFVYIVDRAKDVIIRGGENVYSVIVEAAIFDQPDVADCAVVGLPHPVLGEEVAAVVVPRPGVTLDEAELREHLATRLAKFELPSLIVVTDEPLPRNPQGKVLKRQLRDALRRPVE